MLIDILQRWSDLGKPLQMIPKDFKDRILEGMHREVRLSYRKWLVPGKEIDMFELLSVIIIYSRCDLNRRLELVFQLFCYNEEIYMQKGEFKYMMNKLCTSIAATIQIKSAFMQELMRNVDSKLLVHNKEYVYERDFVNSMNLAFRELNERLSDITAKSDNFSLNFRVNRIP
jgi:Ca2+-binding EF-hand superfamily protein